MNENQSSILIYLNNNMNINSKDDINNLNINDSKNKKIIESDKIPCEDIDKEAEELYDNLGYNKNNNKKKRLDSIDSPINAQFKFSIDMPNVPKQRLHEYLNDDLLNALEISPNIPKINDDIQNMKINESNKTDNIINDPNSLFGFSLYPPNNDNNFESQNNYDIISDISNNNNDNINENINNRDVNNKSNINYINNNLIANINFDDTPVYIPLKMRNTDQKQINDIKKNKMNIKSKKNDAKKRQINKFDKKSNNKEGKIKRNFEVRIGDWTCSKCSNLNFSFRNKCNRCGLPKEILKQQNSEIKEINNQKINYETMDYINQNLIYVNDKEMNICNK